MDAWTQRVGVAVFGVVGGLCVGGIVLLEALGHTAPTALSNLASAALSAVAVLISPRAAKASVNQPRPKP